ncbi:MAG TPA: exo-alpha-sialidase [Planctomycetota bacterium]|nr:exo-alpha-sialidase [Planctomycetota bacterium]
MLHRSTLHALALAAVLISAAAEEPSVETVDAAGRQPRAAIMADQSIAVVFGRGEDIVVRVRDHDAAGFGDARVVARVPGLMVGMRRGPQLAVLGDALLVGAIGSAGDLLSWVSTDRGVSWSSAQPVSDTPKAAREGLFSLAGDGEGGAVAVWLDLRHGKTRVYAARRQPQGSRWSANSEVYRSPDGSVCECCQPTVAADGKRIAVMWRNHIGGARDMYVAASQDAGRSFSPAAKVGSGSWKLDACPMDGGGISLASTSVETIWRRDAAVIGAVAGKAAETAHGNGRNAAIASGGTDVHRAWEADGQIVVQRNADAAKPLGGGAYPHLAAARGEGPCVVVWERDGAIVASVMAR